jgi:beta-lactamase superfamily II metal-dependent hydrolase
MVTDELRIRMYRVGFGDFFLLTVPSPDGPQHVLIDCGVTPGTTKKGDIGTIKDAVAHMADETGKHLALIIATHRHQDHIIGFSRCREIFEEFTVDAIWMPYWESEYENDASKMQAELQEVALAVQQQLALYAGDDLETEDMLGMLRNATGFDHEELMAAAGDDDGTAKPKKGKGGGTNAASLAILKGGLGVTPEYLAKGDKPKLPKGLAKAGLKAEILGPPPADALDFMKLKDLKKSVGQYLGEGGKADATTFDPFGEAWHAKAEDYPASAFREFAPRVQGQLPDFTVRYNAALEDAVQRAQPKMLLTAVKALDGFLNNQSLVVLFTYQGKKLLFVGDAQAGNWEYWMYGGTPSKAPSIDDLTAEGKKILGQLDFYKVGHHGSTNATPITAVEAMGGTFVSMCSTEAGTFGTVENQSEVPRDPLIEALAKKSSFVRSDQVAVTLGDGAPAPAEKRLPKPKQGRLVKGEIYVDYFL